MNPILELNKWTMLYGLLTTDYFCSNLNVAHLPRVEGVPEDVLKRRLLLFIFLKFLQLFS